MMVAATPATLSLVCVAQRTTVAFTFSGARCTKPRLRVGPDICMSRPPVALFSSASFAMIEATVVLAILVHAFRFNVVTGHRPDPVRACG
jgi:hypothetical protein